MSAITKVAEIDGHKVLYNICGCSVAANGYYEGDLNDLKAMRQFVKDTGVFSVWHANIDYVDGDVFDRKKHAGVVRRLTEKALAGLNIPPEYLVHNAASYDVLIQQTLSLEEAGFELENEDIFALAQYDDRPPSQDIYPHRVYTISECESGFAGRVIWKKR